MLVPNVGVVVIIGVFLMLLAAMIFLTHINSNLKKEVMKEQAHSKKILRQKKSSEVRLGRIGENMAPFVTDWPYDQNRFRFLGNPVDGVQFTDSEIIFIEIKTGKSRLSHVQKNIKKLIAEGKVSFATFRVAEHGCVFKKEEMNHCNLCDDEEVKDDNR